MQKPKQLISLSSTDELPDFMRRYEGRGTENIRFEDCAWLGDDGSLDADKLLKERGYDPKSSLELLLLSVIRAHPFIASRPRKRTDAERLNAVLSDLLGTPRRLGREPEDDYDLELAIAWRYWELKFKKEQFSLRQVIIDVLNASGIKRYKNLKRADDGENPIVLRFLRKFKETRIFFS